MERRGEGGARTCMTMFISPVLPSFDLKLTPKNVAGDVIRQAALLQS